MADIELKCPKCSKSITVSEFADVSTLTCHVCGEPLQKRADAPEIEKVKRSIKLAEVATEQEEIESTEPTKWQISQQAAIDKRPKRKFELTHLLWSTVIFFVLGGVMAYLRYTGDGYLANNKDLVRLCGPAIIIILHIFVVLGAFKDSVFQGTLCTLVPGYSAYYLFFVSDNFYLRGLTGGLLIGLGQDSMVVFQEWGQAAYNQANDFISSGGGALKSTPRTK